MLSSIVALMQGLVDLVKVLKRPGYMVLALALLAVGFELLAGGFWLRLFNWMLGGVEFSEVLETQLSKDPVQGTLGIFFILLSVSVVCYFESIRMRSAETHPKKNAKISAIQKRLLKVFQHKKFDRHNIDQFIDESVLKAAALEPVNTFSTLHIRHVEQWVLHPKSINTTFTELSLLMDYGKDDTEGRFRVTAKFSSLNTVLSDPEHQQHQSFVLLGRPGGGKSTLLKHLQYELSLEALISKNITSCAIPFFIRLNEYPPENDTDIPPNEWLAKRWSQAYPELPRLEEVQTQGRVVFLLDAINEMRCTNMQDYLTKVKRWKQWLVNLKEQYQDCRAVFTCRSLNYSESLSTEMLIVPQIQFEDFSDEKVQQYLSHYLPNEGQVLFERLKQVTGFSEFKTPFYLNLAIEYYQYNQDFALVTPSSLIASMVWLALERELRKSADKFSLKDLTDKDRKRIIHCSWLSAPHKLPDEGVFIQYLIKVAWLMQQGCSGSDSHQVNISEELLIERLVKEGLELEHITTVLELASDLEFLERDVIQDSCQFTHQILQEYFAAHEWIKAPDFSMIQQPYLIDDMQESLEKVTHKLSVTDPLPTPPSQGWEQTALHAVSIVDDKQYFIQNLVKKDFVLAARCAIQQQSHCDPVFIHSLQQRLLSRMQDERVDLRVRVAAGHVLGDLGDPRFSLRVGDENRHLCIEPHWAKIQSGTYILGANNEYDQQRPMHALHIDEFEISQYPVTNAEWKYFIDDGGYEDSRWWTRTSPAAEQWRQGQGVLGNKASLEWFEKRYQEFKNDFVTTEHKYSYTPYRALEWKRFLSIPYDDFLVLINDEYGNKKFKHPRNWFDSRFNNPSQPVIGVCWYEALAYCHWLSDKLGKHITLPSEEQWQAAAYCHKGKHEKLIYPWGNQFVAMFANTDDLHIRTTSPVGLFARGVVPEEANQRDKRLYDMVGNCWEWTKSQYQAYPIHSEDGRNQLQHDGLRVKVGGSWTSRQSRCTLSFRAGEIPIFRYNNIGFRVASD